MGEFTLHIPNLCIGEARQAILNKCQPRKEADAIRRFLTWAEPSDKVSEADATSTRIVLDKYEANLKKDLRNLDENIKLLGNLPYLKIFALNDAMLARATELAINGIAVKPFDHAILSAILVRASELWETGERELSFCETDADLHPWDRYGNPKPSLKDAFDQSHVWVYSDFTLTQPQRLKGFE